MSDYKDYPPDTMVKIKATGEIGEAFESAFGFISVFLLEDRTASYFKLDEVEFISTPDNV